MSFKRVAAVGIATAIAAITLPIATATSADAAPNPKRLAVCAAMKQDPNRRHLHFFFCKFQRSAGNPGDPRPVVPHG